MKALTNALKCKKGEMYIQAVVYIIILMMVFLLLLTFTLAVSVVSSQVNSADQILDQYIQLNGILIYGEVKEHSDKTEAMLQDLYVDLLVQQQKLVKQNDAYHALNADGNPSYKISDITLGFEEDFSAKAVLSYKISVPMHFIGKEIWAEVPVKVISRFTPKFD